MAKSQLSEKQQRKITDRISRNISNFFQYNSENIDNYRNDKSFTYGDQWSSSEKSSFTRLKKPIFTYNKIYEFVKRAAGEQRASTSNMEITSVDGKGNQSQIDLIRDVIRGIEYESKADIAYQNSFENMLSGGIGAWRIKTDYENPKSFNQKAYIEKIDYPERIFYDPSAKNESKDDGDFMGTYVTLSRDKFESEYPDEKFPESFPIKYNNIYFNWGNKDEITIVEYYEKKYKSFTLYLLDNGESITKKEYIKMRDDIIQQITMGENPTEEILSMVENELPRIKGSRKSRSYDIVCYKATANKIIEKYNFPSNYFPFIIGAASKTYLDGKEIILSAIRFARDPQRFLNFSASDMAQAVKNNRREQFMATASNIDGYEKHWVNPANQLGVLPYNPDERTQQPPIRLPVPEVPQTLMINMQRADLDIQSTLGFFDAMRGSDGQEVSGVAIQKRQLASSVGLNIYFDNLNRMIEQSGRVLLSLIPKIYDTERLVTAVNKDGKSYNVTINQEGAGIIKNDLVNTNFNISVNAGPNYAVQKEQQLQLLIEMVKINPNTFPLVADLLASSTTLEITPELIERFKTLVPPDIIAKEKGLPAPPAPPPNPQQQLVSLQADIQKEKLDLERQRLQLDYEKNAMQHQIDMGKLKLQQDELMIDRETGNLKASAEIGKAHLNYAATKQNAISKIINSRTSIAKDHYDTIRHIHDLNR